MLYMKIYMKEMKMKKKKKKEEEEERRRTGDTNYISNTTDCQKWEHGFRYIKGCFFNILTMLCMKHTLN